MEKIKSLLPEFSLKHLRKLKSYANTYRLFWGDRKRFLKAYAKSNSKDVQNIKSLMIFYGHSIEKGLSRENPRVGFGKKIMLSLLEQMKRYDELGFDKGDVCFINAASIVNEYFTFHAKKNSDIAYIPKKFNLIIEEIGLIKSQLGGVRKIISMEKVSKKKMNFKALASSRCSIRDFDDTNLDMNLVREAIEIASKSPSVCNRQSARIYIITDKEKIEQILKIQGGFNGYTPPPCLILVTSDIRCFIDVSERNQPYIDGGIFSMSLVYALEYQGFATCILNAMLDSKKMKITKDLLGIQNSENLILYISVGNSKNDYTVPRSFRYPIEQISRFY